MFWQDLLAIGFLVVLEGLLSFDNALVLAALVKHLPQNQQKKALIYGVWGAVGFRLLALAVLLFLLRTVWVRFLGGAYLLYMAGRHFFGPEEDESQVKDEPLSSKFWKMILFVELTDIMFSMDSVLASVAVSHKLWIVFTGGMIGILMMRFVSSLFIKLIDVFPRLEDSAFLLVMLVGAKLIAEGFKVSFDQPRQAALFWGAMGASLLYGFTQRSRATVTVVNTSGLSPGMTVIVGGGQGNYSTRIEKVLSPTQVQVRKVL